MKSFFIELSGKIINTTIPLILIMFSGSVSAQTISVKEVSGYTRNHDRKDTINVNYYIDNKGLERKPYVQFANTVPSLISREYSEVQIWRNNGVITNCIDWKRISNIVPGDGSPYLAFQNYDGCRFNIPDYNKSGSPNRIDAQINYRIGYSVVSNNGINKGGPWQLSYRKLGSGSFRCYPSDKVASTNDCESVTLKYGEIKYYEESSTNYRIFWCGDGLLNGPNGSSNYDNGSFSEECDPNDSSKKNWGAGGCDCNCKRIIHDNAITSNKTPAKPTSTENNNPKYNNNETASKPTSPNHPKNISPTKTKYGVWQHTYGRNSTMTEKKFKKFLSKNPNIVVTNINYHSFNSSYDLERRIESFEFYYSDQIREFHRGQILIAFTTSHITERCPRPDIKSLINKYPLETAYIERLFIDLIEARCFTADSYYHFFPNGYYKTEFDRLYPDVIKRQKDAEDANKALGNYLTSVVKETEKQLKDAIVEVGKDGLPVNSVKDKDYKIISSNNSNITIMHYERPSSLGNIAIYSQNNEDFANKNYSSKIYTTNSLGKFELRHHFTDSYKDNLTGTYSEKDFPIKIEVSYISNGKSVMSIIIIYKYGRYEITVLRK